MEYDFDENFAYFDRTSQQKIDPEDLESFFHSCGLSPLKEDIKKIRSEIGNGPITYETLVTYTNSLKKTNTQMSKEELIEIFKPFDRDANGQIMVAEFRNITSQLGDGMSNEEIDQILSYTEISPAGTFAYENLIDWTLKI